MDFCIRCLRPFLRLVCFNQASFNAFPSLSDRLYKQEDDCSFHLSCTTDHLHVLCKSFSQRVVYITSWATRSHMMVSLVLLGFCQFVVPWQTSPGCHWNSSPPVIICSLLLFSTLLNFFLASLANFRHLIISILCIFVGLIKNQKVSCGIVILFFLFALS